MTIIRFIGDVHGKFGRYRTILQTSPHRTHQVGDMGVGFLRWPHGEPQANPPFDLMVEKEATFHRGNHDSPKVCREHKQCIQDGTVIDNMMFIGGALSIDKAMRIPDFSWWENEELPSSELRIMKMVYGVNAPPIMVTHECPESIAEMIVGSLADLARPGQKIKLDPRFASRTRFAFESMFRAYKPKLWLFGHWHVPFDQVVNGTRFICLPELACLDVDVDRAEVVGDLIPQH